MPKKTEKKEITVLVEQADTTPRELTVEVFEEQRPPVELTVLVEQVEARPIEFMVEVFKEERPPIEFTVRVEKADDAREE